VAARIFEDSAGTTWEVFQVHRASEASRGVSAGLEQGWLAFVSVQGKRRLAPFPASWESAPPEELERLCAAARVANPPYFQPRDASSPGEAPSAFERRGSLAGSDADLPDGANLVRDAVRRFAHDARAKRLPAIEAMVQLKAMLAESYGGAKFDSARTADARDMRKVRRWFVEAFYFERRA
jgi:hypothetical protein